MAYYGRYLVYNRDDNVSSNVSIYDTRKQKDIKVTDAVGSRWATDLDNNKIVYIDGGGYGDLYVYNINTKQTDLITQHAAVPKISGKYIVWYISTGSGVYDIRAYDLSKKQLVDIPNPENASRQTPDIDGNSILYP